MGFSNFAGDNKLNVAVRRMEGRNAIQKDQDKLEN